MFLRNLGSTYKNKEKISHVVEGTYVKTYISPDCSNYSQMLAVINRFFFLIYYSNKIILAVCNHPLTRYFFFISINKLKTPAINIQKE